MKKKIKLCLLICPLIIIFAYITFLGNRYFYNQIKLYYYGNKFDNIDILYDYGSIMGFSNTFENSTEDNMLKIKVQGEQLIKLQNILKNYDIESNKYKLEETGHYHGTTFYGVMPLIPAQYRITFNDDSEMIINERNYEIQYKNRNNYYLITDGKNISHEIIKIVDENLHKETIKMNTKTISITGLTSNNILNINDQETILKMLNEFRYIKDTTITKELYENLIKHEKDDYENKRKNQRELEYKINFNNGTIIKIGLRNGNIGCISDDNNNFIEGIKINSKFVYMIHNYFTDYYREKDKLFETEEVYIKHNNIEKKLSSNEKKELLNKLLLLEIDGESMIKYDLITPSPKDYVLKINNNEIILNENNLYIIYPNRDNSYIYSLDLVDYIKNLIPE